MRFDVIVVGGGIAGLTAAAYVAKAGYTVMVCERQDMLGGYVNSFEKNGFMYDQGIRAIENSGIVFPMFRQLGLEIEFVKSKVSLGVGDRMIQIDSPESLVGYEELLNSLFPENRTDIAAILGEIRKIMGYMDILYGIDNPLFLDTYTEPSYLLSTFLPWLFTYMRTMPKIAKLNDPVDTYLRKFTTNQQLIDTIAQHFFKKTPAFFALSYFSLYLDYNYPKGGTGAIAKAFEKYIIGHGGEVHTGVAIQQVDVDDHTVIDEKGISHSYGRLIWAADLKKLYSSVDYSHIESEKVKDRIKRTQLDLADKTGGDSIFTLFTAVDLPIDYFAGICSAHCFYTPDIVGISGLYKTGFKDILDGSAKLPPPEAKERLLAWLKEYFLHTTYEISFPAMRDPNLVPEGKTGIVISTLFDYPIARYIADAGWYDEFKVYCEDVIISTLTAALMPRLAERIIERFSSTPLTMERITGNSDGAITGWAFTNSSMPVESRLVRVMKSVDTPIPGVLQAGQWTFSPSGLPISVLTGRIAADKAIKFLKKNPM